MSTVEREDWGVQEVQEGCYGCPWGQGKSKKSNEVKRDVKGVPKGQLSTTDIPGAYLIFVTGEARVNFFWPV